MYKPKILVVEDDLAITNLIRTTLDTQEYQYHTAQNGAGALLDAVSYNPDVIILDLGLPDMDGVEIILMNFWPGFAWPCAAAEPIRLPSRPSPPCIRTGN